MAKKGKYIVGLDIGTQRTTALIAELREDGGLDVIGAGSTRSEGLRKGAIVNLEKTVNGIRRAVEEAELMSGAAVDCLYVNLDGAHLKGVNSRGVVAVANRSQGVSDSDIRRVIESAQAIPIPGDRETVHVIPQEFVVDDQDGIGDPMGMTGARLEASVHIVTASRTAVQNVETCVNRAGFEVLQMVASPLAASEAVLTHDEKELGAGLLDIGGGTTGLVLFERGSPVYTAVVPLGSDNITSDISIGLRSSIDEAEKIKKRHGCALTSLVGEDETIEVTGMGRAKPRVVTRRLVSDIIQHRVDEIFRLVAEEIHQGGFERALNAGYVLTGGGSSLEGMMEVAESILGAGVRPGAPGGVGGLTDVVKSPEYAVGVGLLMYGRKDTLKQPASAWGSIQKTGERVKNLFKGWF
jgi:cell division protein FtsA